jgi:hypothetical protein
MLVAFNFLVRNSMHVRTLSFLMLFGAAPVALIGCGGGDSKSTNVDDMAGGGGKDMGGGGGGQDGGGGGDMATEPDPLLFGSIFKVRVQSLEAIPPVPLSFDSDTVINTGIDPATNVPYPICNQSFDKSDQYCIVAATDITIASGKTLRAIGPKPLVLLATGTFTLNGTIDVSSRHDSSSLPDGSNFGAGSTGTAALCTETTDATVNGGGFGGSFGGAGGDGTSGSGNDEQGVSAPALPLDIIPPTLRAGCPGGRGSSDSTNGTPGVAGKGGGAVAIIAGDVITINGKINASGAGGTGATSASIKSGGAGGGSGGTIVLDSPSITVGSNAELWLFANGGGGGQGTSATPGTQAGANGAESLAPYTPANGGNNSNSGGPGGRGAAGPNTGDEDGKMPASGSSNDGGGGGGGGAGIIVVVGTPALDSVSISPPVRSPN